MPCIADPQNILGYNSCVGTDFKSVDSAIDTVAKTLAGKIKATKNFYEGKTLAQKLRKYNGPASVADENYVRKVLGVMKQIDGMDISVQTASTTAVPTTGDLNS